MAVSHNELPRGKHFPCPKTGMAYHCAYCHRMHCPVCVPCERCDTSKMSATIRLGKCTTFNEWKKCTEKKRFANNLGDVQPKCLVNEHGKME